VVVIFLALDLIEHPKVMGILIMLAVGKMESAFIGYRSAALQMTYIDATSPLNCQPAP
jgi:hypothetical protein